MAERRHPTTPKSPADADADGWFIPRGGAIPSGGIYFQRQDPDDPTATQISFSGDAAGLIFAVKELKGSGVFDGADRVGLYLDGEELAVLPKDSNVADAAYMIRLRDLWLKEGAVAGRAAHAKDMRALLDEGRKR